MTAHASSWLTPHGNEQLWPELIARATIHTTPFIQAISAHIPNGSGNGWAKIDHFEALAR